MGINDIPATELIEAVAQDLKGKIQEPNWIDFVKSGRHRERAPHRRDWFYVRMASILYRINKNGILGTNRLRSYYGGRKNRGVRPHKFFKASGKIIRVCLQELEKEGLIKKEKAGRNISNKGKSYLNAKAKEVGKTLAEKPKQEVKVLAKEKPSEAEQKPKQEAKTKEVKEEKPQEAKVEEAKPEKVEAKEEKPEAKEEKAEPKKEEEAKQPKQEEPKGKDDGSK